MKYRMALFAGLACWVTASGVAAAEAQPAQEQPAKQKKIVQNKAAAEAGKCTHAPGSHIRLAKPEDCAKAARGPYRSYSKEELERTGEINLADALRKLDPTFH